MVIMAQQAVFKTGNEGKADQLDSSSAEEIASALARSFSTAAEISNSCKSWLKRCTCNSISWLMLLNSHFYSWSPADRAVNAASGPLESGAGPKLLVRQGHF